MATEIKWGGGGRERRRRGGGSGWAGAQLALHRPREANSCASSHYPVRVACVWCGVCVVCVCLCVCMCVKTHTHTYHVHGVTVHCVAEQSSVANDLPGPFVVPAFVALAELVLRVLAGVIPHLGARHARHTGCVYACLTV